MPANNGGQKHCEQLIEHIAKTAGCFFEETYRENTHNSGRLDIENYTELILGLKNNIGGKFSLASSNQDCITVINSCCSFGDRVTNFPELCRMTSSVFGGIAARNFGYAKVEIKKSIARHDGQCEVCIYTHPQHTVYLGATPEYGKAEFLRRLTAEIERVKAHFPNAKRVGLADGAECNWQFLTPHTQIQVLDFYHASSYLGAVANAKYPKDKSAHKTWLEDRCHQLKHTTGAAEALYHEMVVLQARKWVVPTNQCRW